MELGEGLDVKRQLINFIHLHPKGLCLILLKRTMEVKEAKTKINLIEL